MGKMSDFKGRHFSCQAILWAVHWYCKYGISYRALAEMLKEGSHDDSENIVR